MEEGIMENRANDLSTTVTRPAVPVQFCAEDVQRTVAALFDPGDVVELRVPKAGRYRTISGYFGDSAALTKAAAGLSGRYPGVYYTLNPVVPALLARCANRVENYAELTTSDTQILRRRRLLIDVDAIRPAGISSTDAEHAAALAKVKQIRASLSGHGWPLPMLADSGNGAHLVYEVDLPVDDGGLLRRALQALARLWDSDELHIDTSVFNPARISKLYGTLVCKGDHTTDRPHRLSRIIDLPDLVPVPLALIEELASTIPQEPPQQRAATGSYPAFDLDAWMATHAPEARGPASWNGTGKRWTFPECPFRPEDRDSFVVVQLPSGAISATCRHDTCPGSGSTGNHWLELREMLAPGGRPRRSEAELIPANDNGHHDDAAADPSESNLAHAEALAELWRSRYTWADHRRSWMYWNEKRWEPVSEYQVAADAADALRVHYAGLVAIAANKATVARLAGLIKQTNSFAQIIGGLSFLKGFPGFHPLPAAWDADPWLLNVQNGAVDLHTGQLKPHDPEQMCTKMSPVNYEPDATGAAWAAHLARFLPNESIRRQVQRDLGLALIGAPMAEMLPIWHGNGANGKSTTARIVQGVMGDYAIQAAPNLLVTRRNEQHPTEIADLCGSRAVFSVEIATGARLDEAKVKDLTGGDTKKGRFMNRDFFQFQQTWNIFLLVNPKPIITGTDNAIWRRVRLVPWTVTIPLDEQRPQEEVVRDILAEGPAVLRWLLAGLADWQQDAHWTADEVKAATSEYREEQDRLGGFLSDICEQGPHYTVGVGALYDAYTDWCQTAGDEPISKRAFGQDLRGRGVLPARKPHTRERIWMGIRLSQAGGTQGDDVPGSFYREDILVNEPGVMSPCVPREQQHTEHATDSSDDLPEVCAECGAPVDGYDAAGRPYCERHMLAPVSDDGDVPF
jgi:P4 family phage/plasmid primase-like protien